MRRVGSLGEITTGTFMATAAGFRKLRIKPGKCMGKIWTRNDLKCGKEGKLSADRELLVSDNDSKVYTQPVRR